MCVVRMELKSPKKWQATFNTNVGTFKLNVYRDWAPRGADRFYSLVQNDFFDGARFFRYADNFVVQWGKSRALQTAADFPACRVDAAQALCRGSRA